MNQAVKEYVDDFTQAQEEVIQQRISEALMKERERIAGALNVINRMIGGNPTLASYIGELRNDYV